MITEQESGVRSQESGRLFWVAEQVTHTGPQAVYLASEWCKTRNIDLAAKFDTAQSCQDFLDGLRLDATGYQPVQHAWEGGAK